MTNPIRHHSSSRACGSVSVQIVRVSCLARLVVDRKVCHINAGGRARHAVHGCTRALEAFKNHFKQLALLRIHISSLEVVDAEKVIVELAYVFVDEVAARYVSTATAITALWVVEPIDVVPFRWDGSLSRLLVDKEVPKVQRRVNIPRKAASCDRVRNMVMVSSAPLQSSCKERDKFLKEHEVKYPFPQYMADRPSRTPYWQNRRCCFLLELRSIP